MCGIAGIVASSLGDARALEGPITAMTRALARRGPDGEGFHVARCPGGVIALGHRRLAVIDVAGGAQPLYAASGKIVCIANGEIYNFAALRAELVGRGHVFATQADSEVIGHGYAEWGEGVLDRLEGMFALAIWDQRDATLLLARDRMGEKPLYYAERDGCVVFASELAALLCHPAIAREIDPLALAAYLVHEHVPAPYAMIRGVHKLAPGQFLVARIDDAPRPRITTRLAWYWDLPLGQDAPTMRNRNMEAAARRLRDALERSVTARLVADVPLGVFLSGGLDSSLIAALACRTRGGSGIDSFSLGFAEPSYDESTHARTVARFLGTRHHEHIVRPEEALALIEKLGELLDEPLGDGSIVPTHLLARFVRGHVTVALSGDGSDELFDGYPTVQADFFVGRLVDHAPRPLGRWLRRGTAALAARLPVSSDHFALDFKLGQLARGLDQRGARRHHAWLASFLPGELASVLADDVAAEVALPDIDTILDQRMARCPSRVPADQRMYFYCKGYLGDGVLTKVDRASMHVALETRAPFLDREVVALACNLAPELRSWGWHGKRVVKRAARGLLPEAIIDRPKHGFAMPIAGWLRGPLRALLHDTLAPGRIRRDGWLDAGAVQAMIDAHVRGQANHRKPLWTLLALHAWLDIVRARPRTAAPADTVQAQIGRRPWPTS